jgi:hypothetical protein
MAHPKISLDWSKIDKLLQSHCSGVGISGLIGVHVNTLYRKCEEDKGMKFEEYRHLKMAEGKELLRQKQFSVAMGGDKTMLVWLGKQYLDQSEKINAKSEISTTLRPILVSDQAQADRIEKMRASVSGIQ